MTFGAEWTCDRWAASYDARGASCDASIIGCFGASWDARPHLRMPDPISRCQHYRMPGPIPGWKHLRMPGGILGCLTPLRRPGGLPGGLGPPRRPPGLPGGPRPSKMPGGLPRGWHPQMPPPIPEGGGSSWEARGPCRGPRLGGLRPPWDAWGPPKRPAS